jgi:hypothetical protein
MNCTFFQLAKAQKEILDAWEWYEDKQLGLGDRFKGEVAKKINTVVKNPLHYPLKGKYRESLVDDFPFLIIFSFNQKENIVFILSGFHMSRHPKRKRK